MTREEANDLLNNSKNLLLENYFILQEKYEKIYGKDTLVLIELGSFFEAYEVNNEEEHLGKAKELSDILNIQLTRKNKSLKEINRKNPYMAGIPTVSLDKHLNRLIQENKYTIVLIGQKKISDKEVKRYITDIISPGTNFSYIQSSDSTYLSSVVIEKYNGIYEVGFSCIDISTGKLFCNEKQSLTSDKNLALDNLKNLLSIYETKELIITNNKNNIDINEIITYLGIQSKVLHNRHKRIKINHQNTLFEETFNIQSYLTPIEYLNLELKPLASESLSILIDFVAEHDYKLLDSIKKPILKEDEEYLYLGNNSLEQLNIKEDLNSTSVFQIINKTKTAIGRRLLKDRLYNPIKTKKELERRYDLSESISPLIKDLTQTIHNVYDIERLSRKMELNRLQPFELNYFYSSLVSIQHINDITNEKKLPTISLDNNKIQDILNYIDKYIDLDKSLKFSLIDNVQNFIKLGVDNEIDDLNQKNMDILNTLYKIKDFFNSLFDIKGDICKIDKTQKEGFYLSISKNKYNSLDKELLNQNIMIGNQSINIKEELSYKLQTNICKINGDFITNLSNQYLQNEQKIALLNLKVFHKCCSYIIENYSFEINDSIYFIGDLDVALSNNIISSKYNLVRPNILDFNENSFIEVKDLRHILVESNEDNGLYVSNDIVLGDSFNYPQTVKSITNETQINNGILLYGINSSGKSTLLKSLGVNTVLAQSGFFVAASSFSFTLMDSLFSRIQGSDNIYKGLSSFAIEMLELKNIFNRATKKSLILGDELSHSTETISGLSIVASALLKFYEMNTLFILATHLHQLIELDEIKNLPNVEEFHLSTDYDINTNTISFDRKLKKGRGSAMYGLEFAASLELDETFLKNADKIRKNITNDFSNIEKLGFKKKSNYNKNKSKISCEVCGAEAEDTHHIIEQHLYKNEDFVKNVKKDHKFNLIAVCKECHNKIHEGKIDIEGYKKTSKGFKLEINIKED